jgi:hypothetical protein
VVLVEKSKPQKHFNRGYILQRRVNLSKKVRVRGASFAHIILLLFIRAHALCRREAALAHIQREAAGRQVKLFVISFFMQGIFTFII